MAKQYPATMSRGIVCLLSAFSAAEAASAKATAAASAAAGTSAEAASAEAAGTAGTAGARSAGSAAAGSRRIRPGRAGARRPGRTAHRRPRGTRRAAMRRTGLVRGSGRRGRRIASAPENGVVHRAHHIHRRTHHIPSPIAAVPHGIQQHPHHEDTDDQHDHRADGRTVGGGRCGRVGGVPAAVTAAAGRVQPGLCIEHVRLPEEGRHRTVEIAAVIGRLDGLTPQYTCQSPSFTSSRIMSLLPSPHVSPNLAA